MSIVVFVVVNIMNTLKYKNIWKLTKLSWFNSNQRKIRYKNLQI